MRHWLGLALLLVSPSAFAATQPPELLASPKLQHCLKRADDLPDIAAFEAEAWIKKNGGNDAHLCRAFAQANRGMHADSAREFWALASLFAKQTPKDTTRELLMHNLAGQEFALAKDVKNADAQFAAALKIAPGNPTALIGRANTRMLSEHYWEALDDLNIVLKQNPKEIAALRQRGLVWMHLGNAPNAQEDFARAAELDGAKKAK